MSAPANKNTTEFETVAAQESVASSLGLDPRLFVFQLINFALVIAIVWWLILKPLTKKMAERKTLIDESLDKAKEIESNLAMSEQKFQARIDEAKVEANKLIERTHDEAERMKESMKKKAKEEIDLLVKQAKKNIEIDREDMLASIRKETAELVVLAVEKILVEKLDGKKDMELIRNTLEQVK